MEYHVEEDGPDPPPKRSEPERLNIEEEQEKYQKRCHTIDVKFGPFRLNFNPVVTVISCIIIWAFIVWCIVDNEGSLKELSKWKQWVTDTWTWLYVGTQDFWALFIIVLYFSKYSNMKLGHDDEQPEYCNSAYFTMLFAAGIGIGLFYYGVAEPIWHLEPGRYGNRYWGRYTDNQRAQDAMNVTFFHWGIHGWIVYVLIGLLLGFLCYRKGLPMTMRTCFYPLLGDVVWGFVGDAIDILSVVCTMFGVCTSLGLGVIQLNAGITRFNSDIPFSTDTQIIIIWLITVVATGSVISGVKVGIRRLSELCFGIGCLILFVVLFADNTWHLMNLYTQSIGYYFQWVIQLGFHTDAFAQLGNAPDGKEAPNWIDGWTIFYWGWWISWSPFVGMFIAKISRGRTIKDFITYTMTIPIFYTFLWLTVFGGAGIQMERKAQNLKITCADYGKGIENITASGAAEMAANVWATHGIHRLSCRGTNDMWFDVMEQYGDIGRFLSVLSLIGIILYFVTSSDSGSLVIDCLSANGHPDPPLAQRIFWALTEGACATALLKAGGTNALKALQTASVTAGLPYTFILNFCCVAMWRVVQIEAGDIEEDEGKWHMSSFEAFNTLERFGKVLVNVLFPWWSLGRTSAMMDDGDAKSKRSSLIVNSIVYSILFYMWLILMIVELEVSMISYVGWALLIAFFAYGAGLRASIREKYQLRGNLIEDFFVFMLMYPMAIVQCEEQCRHSERERQTHSVNTLEMQVPPSYNSVMPNDNM